MQNNLKKLLPFGLAIAIFAIVTLIYFSPLLKGKVLKQDDIARHKGMSKEIIDFREKHGEEPLWTNSMFGGMPAYQISTLYPGNWIAKLDNAFKLFVPHPGSYVFLYCLGFFILLLCFEVNVWLAIIGALAYGLSSYFLIIIEAGHNSKANALGYLPAMVGGVVLLFRGKHWLGLAVTTLFTAMELNCNHVQITYYGYILVAFMIGGYLWLAFKQKQLKQFGIALALFIFASLLGALPNAGNLMATAEYGKYSTRGKTELTVDPASVRAARSTATPLDGTTPKPSEGFMPQGVMNPALKERAADNLTSGLDKDYALQWSYGIGETFTFLIPDFKGGPSDYIAKADKNALKKVNPEYREAVAQSGSYFGDQPFTSGPVYIGAIVVFLALLGLLVLQNPIKWAIFFGTLLTIALSWGQHFKGLSYFFLDHVPGYNKFRAVSMILVIAELTLPLLAVLGVNELIKHRNWKETIRLRLFRSDRELSIRKVILFSASVIGGFCLLCYLAPDLVNTFHGSTEEEEMVQQAVSSGQGSEDEMRAGAAQLMTQIEIARKAIFRSDALRSLIFILLSLGVLMLYFTEKISRQLLLGALGVFILIDLWTVDQRYLNEKSFITKEQNEAYITGKTETDAAILRDTALDYRVLNLSTNTFNDASTSFYHKSIGGYHGAKLKRYKELIDFHLDEDILRFRKNAGKVFGSDSLLNALLAQMRVVNMLNTKYLIIPADNKGNTIPLPNRQAYGNAWFVKELRLVNDADSEIVGLYYIDPKVQALINRSFAAEMPFKPGYSAEGSIRLLSYEPNHLVYESQSEAEQLAVFSEIYYPKGWNAYMDGELKPHACANYVLRALPVPAGKHKIEFKFEPKVYETGNTIAMLGSLLVLVTAGAGIFMGRKRKEFSWSA